ncbi:hypothetical protein E2562_011861 [Oryza meyeriana var. granulata]|uniref:Uncharacterized protein n=1 Tax=Oryza meyeriana var. granulata TaxID=110450 RepID=A0A6G1CF34_9ORYZ|nr:hypothetical protein E2562_011861 [Oryza meyeriana var. granulata]
MVRSMDRYLTQTCEELYRAQARIIMIDHHIEPMGNMGFFNEEIIYGVDEIMAPAKFLPHPSGYYEQVNQRLRMSTGYRHNYCTMAAPTSVPMGDPIEPGHPIPIGLGIATSA